MFTSRKARMVWLHRQKSIKTEKQSLILIGVMNTKIVMVVFFIRALFMFKFIR